MTRARIKCGYLFSIGDIAAKLSKAGFSLGWVSAIDLEGRTIWIVDAHRDGQRFIVHADEILTAFLELERVVQGVAKLAPPYSSFTASQLLPSTAPIRPNYGESPSSQAVLKLN